MDDWKSHQVTYEKSLVDERDRAALLNWSVYVGRLAICGFDLRVATGQLTKRDGETVVTRTVRWDADNPDATCRWYMMVGEDVFRQAETEHVAAFL